jgi:hypothetical protein
MYITIYNDIISRKELFYSQRLIPLIYRGRNTKHDNFKMFSFANINIWCHEIFKFNSTQTGKFMTCVIYLYIYMLLYCNSVLYTLENCLQLHMMWSCIIKYSGVMNLISQWLRNRQWWKNYEFWAYFPIKHLIIMRITVYCLFPEPPQADFNFSCQILH